MNKDGSNSDYALEFLRFMAREDQLNTPASVKGVPSIAKNAPDERYSNLNSIEKVEASIVCDGSVAGYVGSCFVSSAADLAGGVTADTRRGTGRVCIRLRRVRAGQLSKGNMMCSKADALYRASALPDLAAAPARKKGEKPASGEACPVPVMPVLVFCCGLRYAWIAM